MPRRKSLPEKILPLGIALMGFGATFTTAAFANGHKTLGQVLLIFDFALFLGCTACLAMIVGRELRDLLRERKAGPSWSDDGSQRILMPLEFPEGSPRHRWTLKRLLEYDSGIKGSSLWRLYTDEFGSSQAGFVAMLDDLVRADCLERLTPTDYHRSRWDNRSEFLHCYYSLTPNGKDVANSLKRPRTGAEAEAPQLPASDSISVRSASTVQEP